MINNDKYLFSNMSLKIVTPSCVADGNKLTARDYFYNPDTGDIYFVNQYKWHQFILKNNLFDKYAEYMATDTRIDNRNLLGWLQDQGFAFNDIIDMVIHKTKAEVNVINPSEKQTTNDVFGHIRLADGRVYIPGSSIKGFLRSAILYSLISKNDELRSEYWKKISNICRYGEINEDEKDKLGEIITNLEVKLLHTLKLFDKRKDEYIKSKNAVTSVMKGLQVSDALPVGDIETVVLQKIDLVIAKEKKENSISVFRESIVPGSEFNFSIRLDKQILKNTGIDSVEKIIDCVNQFIAFINRNLSKAFSKDYPGILDKYANANIYLGGNTGFLTKTLVAALAPTTEDAKDIIKVIMESQFKSAEHMMQDKIISPRTLKATKFNGEIVPMGLAEILIKDE